MHNFPAPRRKRRLRPPNATNQAIPMNSRTAILITSGVAVAALIALAVVVYAAGTSAGEPSNMANNGSLLHPRLQRDARDGYVIAELYQDVGLDIRSGVYGEDGLLQSHHWTHDDVRQSCGIDLVLAVQQGIDQAPPAPAPQPTHTPLPTDAPRNPEEYQVVERTVETDNGAGVALALVPTPRADWPTSTPRPTYTPYPTPTRSPLISSVSWIGWAGRPIAIEADGIAVLDVPRDANVATHLSVWTGVHRSGQTRLARLPLPHGEWKGGQARVRLREASGRILLASDHVDAHHRSARVRINVSPIEDCGTLRLRWEKPPAVVVRALTEQPYADWGDHRLPPAPMPAAATLSGLTLTGVNFTPTFDPTTTAYTASVPYATAETTVRPVLADPNETYTVSRNGVQFSDNVPAVVELALGVNNITITVTAEDRTTTQNYVVNVHRAGS